MKIMLAVDGSPHTQRLLDYIASHPDLLGTQHRYILFTAVTSFPAHTLHLVSAKELQSSYEDAAQAVLGPVKTFTDAHGLTAQIRHAAGYPPDVIADFATAEQVDLLVMGSHGHSALANLVMGSVVGGVLARCRVPMLLIR